ncbi:MAG: type II toxin-antitoxin system RelE/ParE family toxin [Deltaproteobacteria bacterium]|nr:type II toxin-antitoxin system RelE/ParE family toxin [Deltaproteobacteria bacterium]
MATRVLPEARDDLREAVRYYRNIKPPVLGKQLATRMMAAFKKSVAQAASMPLGRPEHPDIPGARYVMFEGFPYMLFYTVLERDLVVVAVEYATRGYVDRIARRTQGAR